jgi:signal transduction histidine kinase
LRKIFSTKPSVADTHDLSAIVRASAEYVGLRRQEGIEHWLDLTEPLPFRCAPADFHMVFSNLFTNAMEAVGERGVVFVTGRRTDQGISIAVEDNGRGVSSEDLIRIYEPFFTTKTGGGNLGIGLTLCRNIVESYGGSMSIESEEGRRTRVAVLLPLEAS